MIEDEEIVCEGNSLYQHLRDLGYADFETFVNIPNPSLINVPVIDKHILNDQNVKFRTNETLSIAPKDYKMLVSILKSNLVFKEDSFVVECAISDISISEKSHIRKMSTLILLGLMSSTLVFKRRTGFFLSCCLTLLCSGYITWNIIKSCLHQSKQAKTMERYLKLSRKLSLNIHKHLRFLNESQILSTAKLQTDTTYKNKLLYHLALVSNKPNEQSTGYPHLRKCLYDSLSEIISIIMLNKALLQNSTKFSSLYDYYCISGLDNPHEIINTIIEEDGIISINVLKQLTELYLILQSEYLRDIGLILSPVTESLSALRSLAEEEVFRQLSSCQNKLADIDFKLSMQYKLHNILHNSKPNNNVVNKFQTLSKFELMSYEKNLYFRNIKIDIHNMFLLLYSALLRVKNFEDYLENVLEMNVNETEETYCKLVSEVSTQMYSLRDDLSSTISGFDVMLQQMLGKTKSQADKPKISVEESPSGSSQTVKETIFLGKTDFSVNSLDEVFMAISNLNVGENSENIDDWCLEVKPQMPKNLLAELSNTLKLRKTDFIERERLAVERQGLQELERAVVLDDSSDEDSVTRTYLNRTKKSVKTQLKSQSASNSEDGKLQQNGDLERNPKIPQLFKKRSQINSSDSDLSSNEDNIDESHSPHNLFTNNSSLANLIASRSQMWGNKSEDFYSDE